MGAPRRSAWTAALTFVAACGAPPVPDASDFAGWPQTIVADPQTFGELVGSDRPGWVALHANDPVRAYARMSETSRPRAAWDAALLHDDLAELSVAAHAALYTAWIARAAPPKGSQAWTVAGLSARCGGHDPGSFAARAPEDGRRIFMAEEPWLEVADARSINPFAAQLALHLSARTGDLDTLYERGRHPVVVESADGFERSFYDPCIHHSLAVGWWV